MSDYEITGPRGRPMRVLIDDIEGLAVDKASMPVIYARDTHPHDLLGTLLHEGVHMCFPIASEAETVQAETFLKELVLHCWYKPLMRKYAQQRRKRSRA